MNRLFALIFILLMGCIEYGHETLLPPVGQPNARPLIITTHTDNLIQVTRPETDVLWVIDNSGSMLDEQALLAQQFPVFMDYFLGSGLDYHIGVVSTDMIDPNHSGKLRTLNGIKYIDSDTPDAIETFRWMAQIGSLGSGDERGRDAAYRALELLKDDYNHGFLRDEYSSLNVIAISDEDDHSFEISKQEFVNWMITLKPENEATTFSSIVSPNPVCFPALQWGQSYTDITDAVGGIIWSICDESWEEVLELLGIQAAGLSREFFLSQLPIPGSISVSVKDKGIIYPFEEEIDWYYDETRNSVIFHVFLPNPLAEVIIEYDLLNELEE